MDPEIKIISSKIKKNELQAICDAWFGDMVKLVVDVQQKIVALGGDLHADAEELLIREGSNQTDLWGANFYPWNAPENRIEYIALINIRPRQNNPGMEIKNTAIRNEIKAITEKLILDPNEQLV